MDARGPIRFLCDENVRKVVADYLEERGHLVLQSREVIGRSSPDQVLALLAQVESLVIVSHDQDFKKFRAMVPEHLRSRFSAGAGRLWLDVPYDRSLDRIRQEIEVIEFHYEQALRNHKPFIMEIRKTRIAVTTL
jgi:hypothetical protein